MPLSEEELRLLEQMERALAAEDPKFVSTIQGHTLERTARIRAVVAGVVFLGGVALLLGGAMAQRTWLGILGFVVMLASAVIGLTAWRGRHAPKESARVPDSPSEMRAFEVIDGGKRSRGKDSKRPAKSRGNRSFMQRLEQRWQHRRQQGY